MKLHILILSYAQSKAKFISNTSNNNSKSVFLDNVEARCNDTYASRKNKTKAEIKAETNDRHKNNIFIIANDKNQLAVKNIWDEKLKEVQLIIVEKIDNRTYLYTHCHRAQPQDG